MENLYEIITENPSLAHNGEHLMTAVCEYYAGRSKELIKCEGYLNNIVKIIGDGSDDFDLGKIPITRYDKDCVALEKELAKFFKVKEVRIYWESGPINAYTVAKSNFSRINAKKNLFDNKNNNMKINVFVYTNIISLCGLTGAEVLAVILHEIGHNFYWCPLSVFSEIVLTISTLGLAPLVSAFYRIYYSIKGEFHNWVRENIPVITNIMDGYNRISVELDKISAPFSLANLSAKLISNPDVIANIIVNTISLKSVTGYGAEKGADSFAARYGYGPEQTSALRKMEAVENTVYGNIVENSGTIGNILSDITALQLDIIAMIIMDPHPNHNQRAAAMLDKLKKDYAKGQYSPEAKKELEREIKRMEEAYESAVTLMYNDDGPNIRKGIYNFLDNITNGHSDLREIFNAYYNSYRF